MKAPLRVLIVDDEPAIVTALTTRLRAAGYETLTAHDGRQALQTASEAKPDLMLLDRRLPEMDGLSVLAACRESPDTKRIPVVVLSGLEADRQAAVQAGADAFLAKPYRGEDLLDLVKKLIESREV